MPKRNLIWIAAILVAAAVALWATRNGHRQRGAPRPNEFDRVEATYRLIQNRYYGPVDANRLQRGAVRGMVSSLDEFSSYVGPQRLDQFESRLRGMASGLGLRLEKTDAQILVIGPMVNSPAHKAGIVGGDVLLEIDGNEVLAMELDQIEAMLDAPSGESVELVIERGAGWRRTFSLSPGQFPIETVQGLCRDAMGQWTFWADEDEGVAYVRICEFIGETGNKLRDTLDQLGGLRGLVLDLRDNPGGVLAAIQEVCDLFLDEGVIGASVGRDGLRNEYVATGHGTFPPIPMVVLINARTASAAEIIAGALRLGDRAVLVGTRTRGKGCVQSMFPLDEILGQVNITTSELLVGAGRSITRQPGSDVWGIDPHPGQELPLPQTALDALRRLRVRAEVLPRSPAPQPQTAPAAATRPGESLRDEILVADRQLARGLELLSDSETMGSILAQAAASRAASQSRPTAVGQESK